MRHKSEIYLFADRLPPQIGGMEMHAGAFIDAFRDHPRFPLTKIISEQNGMPTGDPGIVFFNSGKWIEELKGLREHFPKALFIYRTGGNEIVKAPLENDESTNHLDRQAFWVDTLNQTIDVLITNSSYTEERLRSLGISSPFARCVGGVKSEDLRASPKRDNTGTRRLFSAARFVPYKNHLGMIALVEALIQRGHNIELRLAGEGPLLKPTKMGVKEKGLKSVVHFLGPLDQQSVCEELLEADVYLQLSVDMPTLVPQGSYIHSECMGRAVLEAVTAGTFVIASPSGALAEVMTQERGLLVDPSDFEAMVDAVENVLQRPTKRGAFTDAYCWTKIFRKYEEIFANERVSCH